MKEHTVPMGGLYIAREPMLLKTVLGSCVSLTLWDPGKKIGGMNHVVLPGSFSPTNPEALLEKRDTRYGIFSLEELLYGMQQLGCRRETMEARLYGGSYMDPLGRRSGIQESNIEFVRNFLEMARITIREELSFQTQALKLYFNTETGEVKVVRL